MTDTAKRVAGPVAVTASTATYYTVPASSTTIIRSIHIANTSTSAAITFTLGIGGTTAALSLWNTFSIPASGAFDWSGFLVLATTETIQAIASTTGLTLTINGVVVT